jgi:hypothetical protein
MHHGICTFTLGIIEISLTTSQILYNFWLDFFFSSHFLPQSFGTKSLLVPKHIVYYYMLFIVPYFPFNLILYLIIWDITIWQHPDMAPVLWTYVSLRYQHRCVDTRLAPCISLRSSPDMRLTCIYSIILWPIYMGTRKAHRYISMSGPYTPYATLYTTV